jgi:hypothetical protein
VRRHAEQERPVRTQLSFTAAADDFDSGARRGRRRNRVLPDAGEVPVAELVVHRLLPLAREALDVWGIDPRVSDRLLGIIEGRGITDQCGAEWQASSFHRLDERHRPADRRASLRVLARSVEHMHSNEPVRSWPA